MHSLNKKCKEKRTTGIFRTFSESKTCFQASKIEFYNVRVLRITKNSFLPKRISFSWFKFKIKFQNNAKSKFCLELFVHLTPQVSVELAKIKFQTILVINY